MKKETVSETKSAASGKERGSALVLSVFVLAILTSMGVALLFVGDAEIKMSQANLRTNKMFYLAEAALEDGRMNLFGINYNEDFTDDLVAAAGGNGVVDFDIDNLVASYDSNGNFTGFSGYGDDVPIKVNTCSVTTATTCTTSADCPPGETCQTDSTAFGDGYYNVFLTNDPIETRTNTADVNERVMLTAIGASGDRTLELAQAIIEKHSILPTIPPATITLLGPDPGFNSGTSNVKEYIGSDCNGSGGVPGLYVPVVGTIGSNAESHAETGIESNPDFISGPYSDPVDTVADLTDPSEPTVVGSGYGAIDPQWQDCSHIQDMLEDLEAAAKSGSNMYCTGPLHCDPTTPCASCDPTQTTPAGITFVDGDYRAQGNLTGLGVLVVTGTLILGGNTSWDGLILVFGEGEYYLSGGGTGVIQGGIMLADIAGPDGIYGTADDCTGGDNGFGDVVYDESGGGNSGTIYCTTSLELVNPVNPYDIVEFKQW